MPEACRVVAAEAKIRTAERFRLNECLEGLAVLGKADEIYLHIVDNLSNSGIKSVLGGSWLADEKH